MLNVFNTQANMMNSMLKSLGITFQLTKIKTKSDECENCIEFIYTMKFDKPELYEAFVKRLKQ